MLVGLWAGLCRGMGAWLRVQIRKRAVAVTEEAE